MWVVRLKGHLGNQLSQLAFAEWVGEKFSVDVGLDIRSGFMYDRTYRAYNRLDDIFSVSPFPIVSHTIMDRLAFRLARCIGGFGPWIVNDGPAVVSYLPKGEFARIETLGQSFMFRSVKFIDKADKLHSRFDSFRDLWCDQAVMHVRFFGESLSSLDRAYYEDHFKRLILEGFDEVVISTNAPNRLAAELPQISEACRLMDSFSDLDALVSMAACRDLVVGASTFGIWAAELNRIWGPHGNVSFPEYLVCDVSSPVTYNGVIGY